MEDEKRESGPPKLPRGWHLGDVSTAMAGEPNVVHVEEPFVDLPDTEIHMIFAGLMIPSTRACRSMAHEIQRWRKMPHPDSL